jgi:ferredoxin
MERCFIRFKNKEFSCKQGENLLDVLLREELEVYNGKAKLFNCRGLGTCGTCAVAIKGKVSSLSEIEKVRLNLPPHHLSNGLRLACQCKVLGNLDVHKLEGFWGHQIEEEERD